MFCIVKNHYTQTALKTASNCTKKQVKLLKYTVFYSEPVNSVRWKALFAGEYHGFR